MVHLKKAVILESECQFLTFYTLKKDIFTFCKVIRMCGKFLDVHMADNNFYLIRKSMHIVSDMLICTA
jgi:hypothetical protein